MLEAYFRGKKELFNGLEIASIEEKKGKSAWKTYPVITFYLASGEFNSENGLEDKTRCVIFLAGGGFWIICSANLKKFLYIESGCVIIILFVGYGLVSIPHRQS